MLATQKTLLLDAIIAQLEGKSCKHVMPDGHVEMFEGVVGPWSSITGSHLEQHFVAIKQPHKRLIHTDDTAVIEACVDEIGGAFSQRNTVTHAANVRKP